MALALSDLIKPLTREEVLASLLTIADTLGLKTSSWQPGSTGRTILAVVAQKVADYTNTTTEAVKGGLRKYATGKWLTLFAESVFGVDRRAASFATGGIQFTNSLGVAYPQLAGACVIANPATGKTYRNAAAFTIAASGVTSPNPTFVADESGTGSDSGPGTITELVTTFAGVTITNPAALLGADEETDDELRQRCADKLGSLSPNGAAEAYAYVAKTQSLSATSVPITRTARAVFPTTGQLTIYLATATGAPSPADVAIVQAAFDKWAEPLCVQAVATGALDKVINCTLQVWVKGSSKTTLEIQNAISTALANYLKGLDIGGEIVPPATDGRVDLGTLESVVRAADTGGRVLDVAFTLPAGDTTLAAAEVAKLGTVTTTVTTVS